MKKTLGFHLSIDCGNHKMFTPRVTVIPTIVHHTGTTTIFPWKTSEWNIKNSPEWNVELNGNELYEKKTTNAVRVRKWITSSQSQWWRDKPSYTVKQAIKCTFRGDCKCHRHLEIEMYVWQTHTHVVSGQKFQTERENRLTWT